MSDALFTRNDLVEMRGINAANLPCCCLIERADRTRSAGGKIVEDWNTVFADVPCRLSKGAVAQNEALEAGQLQNTSRWTVVFKTNVSVLPGDRMTITGRTDGVAWTRVLIAVSQSGPKSFETMRKVTALDPTASGR